MSNLVAAALGVGILGDVTLYADGTAVGTGRVAATQPLIFSDDHDHFIDPDERFRIAMARQ